jgi:hypothetical protein
MAIGGVSFPTPQAYSGGADFTPLANLPKIYQQAQEDAQKRDALNALGDDPTANMQTLIKSGVPSLAQLGLSMQSQQAARDEQVREFNAQQSIRQAAENRAQQTFDEDTPTGRAQKLVAAGLKPNDYRLFVATGQNPPSEIAAAQERRAQTTFEQGQAVATPEARRQTAVAQGWDVKDPGIRNWIVTGQNLPDLASANKASLQPVYGTRKNPATGQDETVMMQPTGTGDVVESKLPPGVSISNKPIVSDTGTHILYIDPITRQVLKSVPKEIAEKERQAALGEGQGKAALNLPSIEANGQMLLDQLNTVQNHKGKDVSLGAYSVLPTVPGTKQADFRAALAQLKGGVFLQAYNTLKGGGAITEVEGAKATDALLRAQTAQSVEAFDAAINDYRKVVTGAVERARTAARGGYSSGMGSGADDAISRANAAIANGADPKKVRQRLIENGVDPGDVGK